MLGRDGGTQEPGRECTEEDLRRGRTKGLFPHCLLVPFFPTQQMRGPMGKILVKRGTGLDPWGWRAEQAFAVPSVPGIRDRVLRAS